MRETKNIVFLGDSLTEYFDWQQRFPEHHVINLGIAGETVDGLLERMDRVLLAIHDPDIVFVMSGINNIAMEDYEIAGPCKQVINKLVSSYERAVIVVQSILPVELSWVDNRVIQEINRSLREIALDYRAEYLDLYPLFLDPSGKPDRSLLLGDGVHLSEKGYEVWSRAVEDFL
ncbi:MAG: GDSL family lipase [Alphaproteobacteria bacterium]|uniref:GDSL family lipase n=1 Tax=Candidatus Nitrobium versatile TaxID=2884831 RepID=A0A953M2L4_9BACT|nr:GDSL family lipase [Candidatus Nitrobium versatile]